MYWNWREIEIYSINLRTFQRIFYLNVPFYAINLQIFVLIN